MTESRPRLKKQPISFKGGEWQLAHEFHGPVKSLALPRESRHDRTAGARRRKSSSGPSFLPAVLWWCRRPAARLDQLPTSLQVPTDAAAWRSLSLLLLICWGPGVETTDQVVAAACPRSHGVSPWAKARVSPPLRRRSLLRPPQSRPRRLLHRRPPPSRRSPQV